MKTILLIEDDDTTRLWIKVILEKAGYRVLEDTDGNKAMRLISAEGPDLILTDLNLPGKGGLEIIPSIRDAQNPVPIIAMSGGDRYGYNFLEMSEEIGANTILYKPFGVDELLQRVGDLLQ